MSIKGERKKFPKNCQLTSYAIVFGQITFFSTIKPVFREKHEFCSIVMLFSITAYYLNRLSRALKLSSKKCLFKFCWKLSKREKDKVSIMTIVIEYAWISLNKQACEYVLNMPKFGIWQSSNYDRVLNMRALHSVLSNSEYVLTDFWIYLRF